MLNIFVEKYNNLSDEELITRIRNNEQEAFEALFDRYSSKLKYIVSHNKFATVDKEDLMQDATISFYYATQMYDFHSSSFSSFLTLCVERSLNSTIKKAMALKRIPGNMIVTFNTDIDYQVNAISAEDEFFVKDNSSSAISIIADKLSELELKVLKSYLDTGSYDATAAELSINKKTVDNALARVRRKLNS